MTKKLSENPTTDELFERAMDAPYNYATALALMAIAKELQFMNRFNIKLQEYLHGFDYHKHDIPRPPRDESHDPNNDF